MIEAHHNVKSASRIYPVSSAEAAALLQGDGREFNPLTGYQHSNAKLPSVLQTHDGKQQAGSLNGATLR